MWRDDLESFIEEELKNVRPHGPNVDKEGLLKLAEDSVKFVRDDDGSVTVLALFNHTLCSAKQDTTLRNCYVHKAHMQARLTIMDRAFSVVPFALWVKGDDSSAHWCEPTVASEMITLAIPPNM
eukprot:970456-Amphidinium_carterae.1